MKLKMFIGLVGKHDSYVLGCTEITNYEMYKKDISTSIVYDPLRLVLEKLREEFEND